MKWSCRDSSAGIDWSLLKAFTDTTITAATMIANPVGGFALKAATLGITHRSQSATAVLNFLKQHGNVKIVSEPRIRALNNQSAMLKVGTDRTFFTQASTLTDAPSPGPPPHGHHQFHRDARRRHRRLWYCGSPPQSRPTAGSCWTSPRS